MKPAATICISAAALAGVASAAAPVISLSLDGYATGTTMQHSEHFTHRATDTDPRTGVVSPDSEYNYEQPHGTAASARHDWTQTCAAYRAQASPPESQGFLGSVDACAMPTAKAYDFGETTVGAGLNNGGGTNNVETDVETRVYVLDRNTSEPILRTASGDASTCADGGPCATDPALAVDFTCDAGSKYLFKYDSKDDAGNRAEQVVFELNLEDKEEPEIHRGQASYTLQCGVAWTMPTNVWATDNIDSKEWLTPQIKVSAATVGGVSLLAAGSSQADLAELSHCIPYKHGEDEYVFQYAVCDDASKCGGGDNCVTAASPDSSRVGVQVVDTLPPTLTVTGKEVVWHECATTYTDGGATAWDLCDSGDHFQDPHETGAYGTGIAPDGTNSSSTRGNCHAGAGNFDSGSHTPMTITDNHAAVVDTATVGDYMVYYDVADNKGNNAVQAHRQVRVRDTTPPVCTLIPFTLHGATCDSQCNLNPRMLAAANGVIDDDGITATDTCDDDSSLTTTKAWNRPMDTTGKNLGSYIRTYSVRDDSNNVAHCERTFTINDDEAPVLALIGNSTETFCPNVDTEYVDKGATCHDFVDGILSHAVESQGSNVNMRVPGTYNIMYTCQDLTGNDATPINRTIIIDGSESCRCPVISINGEDTVTVEAGFEYIDLGATSTDDLDGSLTANITDDGNTVQTSGLFYHARSCAEVKTSRPTTTFTGDLNDGKYIITTWAANAAVADWKRTPVECDMTSGTPVTYLYLTGATESSYGNVGDCANYGMEKLAYTAGMTLPPNLPTDGVLTNDDTATSNQYICTNPAITLDSAAWDAQYQQSNVTTGAEKGTYVITYNVQNSDSTSENAVVGEWCPASQNKRTVIVKDTLAPVVALHLNGETIHIGDSTRNDEYNGFGVNGEKNPAGNAEVNPYLFARGGLHRAGNPYINAGSASGVHVHDQHSARFNQAAGDKYYMAEETQTSTSAWIVGAVSSAVTGLALLGYSQRKATVTTVPV